MDTPTSKMLMQIFGSQEELEQVIKSSIDYYFFRKNNPNAPIPEEESKEEPHMAVTYAELEDISPPINELMTVKQFAKYFQVSETSTRLWIRKGLVPFIRIGNRIRIPKSEAFELRKKRGKRMRWKSLEVD